MDHREHGAHCDVPEREGYKERFWQVISLAAIFLVVTYLIPFLNPAFDAFIDYLKVIWWAVLLGLLLGGIIDRFIPQEYVSRYLARPKKSTIFNAAILGFIMSACSHGILAISIQLYKKGASVPAVIAFLLAAPWANLPITVLFFSFFGIKALLIIISAMVIAIITGLIYQVLDRHNLIEKSKKGEMKEFSMMQDVKTRWKGYKFNVKKDMGGVLKGVWQLNKMVTWWILIGVMLASIINAYVPTEFFHQYMGATMLGLLITIIVATIIEVCSEGSAPLAFELFKQTGALGNSFAFLMAGVATDYTEIGLIWTNIGKKAAIWLPVITIPQILLLAWAFNVLL